MWKFYTINNQYINPCYLETVWTWYQGSAPLLKSNWMFEDDKEKFIADVKKGMNFAGLNNDIFVAMVHGEEKAPGIIEGHLFAQPKTEIDFLAALVTFSKHKALEKYHTVLTQTPTKHKTMLDINYRAGFIDTGIKSWHALHKGQLVEVQHNIAQ